MPHTHDRPRIPRKAPAPRPRNPSVTVVALAFAGIAVAVMQTLLVPVIKDLPDLLDTSPANATWVMTSTLLAGAVSTPVLGRLGDLYGKRRMLFVSLGAMIVGSVVCALTDSLVPMLAGRTLQGLAMGAIPLGIGIMRDVLPRERLGGAMALMSSSIGVGGGLALPLAAIVAQHAGWHALFLLAAGLGVVSLALVVALVPDASVRAPGRFDLPGALGLSLGLVCLLLPVTKGADWGWGSARVLGLFGLGVLVLLGWGWYELRAAAPLVDLRTSARREVLLANLASVMVGVSFYVVTLVLPQLLQLPEATGYGLGQSMVVAGLCVAPLGLTMMATAPLYARIAARRGPRLTLLLGLLVIGIGYGAGLGLLGSAWQTVLIAVLVGGGIGLAYSSLPALIIAAVRPEDTGAANGLNALMRSIGTSVSSAVIGMVLAGSATPHGGVAVPSMSGFRTSFVIALCAVAGGLVLAWFLPRAAGGGERLTLVELPGTRDDFLLPDGFSGFRGEVRDAEGALVVRATVTLIDRRGRQAGLTTTDTAGRYALPAFTAGPYVVACRATGHTPRAAAVSFPGGHATRLVPLVLAPLRDRSGRAEAVSG
ncbi:MULTISPECIES: MFS transporter [Streptomyces]|uniref:MFS transporter n=1 Tax=Streptomyces evansiae TaxID=3075535 RepID=A0ABD5DZ43_9ACTN|nr:MULTISPECIES: MFS transporter [unclassified Streptomyces]ASY35241.1 MFS transporter [Streptomyces sp. CLI2509]MDT0413996.1 MFS transporter [Streptomyces sp. DSM 41982]MYX19602.1 MFS transporter [Streptomyces sp. SID8380]